MFRRSGLSSGGAISRFRSLKSQSDPSTKISPLASLKETRHSLPRPAKNDVRKCTGIQRLLWA
jgi:hypothetical protein